MSTTPSTINTAAAVDSATCNRSDCTAPASHHHYLRSGSGRVWLITSCLDHRADARGTAALHCMSVVRVVRIQVLHDAAELLRTQGWCQGGFYPGWADTLDSPNLREAAEEINKHGYAACITGALTACGAEEPELLEVAAALLGDHVIVPHPADVLADWQDKPGRTKAEVLDLLGRAARREVA